MIESELKSKQAENPLVVEPAQLSRRDFAKLIGVSAAALGLGGSSALLNASATPILNIARAIAPESALACLRLISANLRTERKFAAAQADIVNDIIYQGQGCSPEMGLFRICGHMLRGMGDLPGDFKPVQIEAKHMTALRYLYEPSAGGGIDAHKLYSDFGDILYQAPVPELADDDGLRAFARVYLQRPARSNELQIFREFVAFRNKVYDAFLKSEVVEPMHVSPPASVAGTKNAWGFLSGRVQVLDPHDWDSQIRAIFEKDMAIPVSKFDNSVAEAAEICERRQELTALLSESKVRAPMQNWLEKFCSGKFEELLGDHDFMLRALTARDFELLRWAQSEPFEWQKRRLDLLKRAEELAKQGVQLPDEMCDVLAEGWRSLRSFKSPFKAFPGLSSLCFSSSYRGENLALAEFAFGSSCRTLLYANDSMHLGIKFKPAPSC